MSDEQDKLGTPNQEAGDAAEEPTTGAPEEEGRGGLPADDIAKLNLEWKAKAEAANALAAENALLKERLAQSPAAQDDDADGEDEDEDLKGTREWADKKDPVAKRLLKLEQRLEEREAQMLKRISDAQQLRDMPEAERQAVYDHYQKNRNRFGDPKAARAELREKTLEEENRTLRDQLRKRDQRPPDNGVRTSEREVPASEHKIRKMTQGNWDRDMETLSDGERMERMRDRRKGYIKVEG